MFVLPLDGAVGLSVTGCKISDENAETNCCDASEEDEEDAVLLFVQVNHSHLSSAPGQTSNYTTVTPVTVTGFSANISVLQRYVLCIIHTAKNVIIAQILCSV